MTERLLSKTRTIEVVLIFGAILTVVAFPRPIAIAQSQEAQPKGLIVFEAEASRQIRPPMAIGTNSTAAGAKFIEIPQGAGNVGGEATYQIEVAESGSYIFWGRANWSDGCGNSLTLVMDGRRPVAFGQDGTYGHWHWIKLPIKFKLTAGKHTLAVRNREDGTKLDQFILTTDKNLLPVGRYNTAAIANGSKQDTEISASDLYFADDFTRTEDQVGVWNIVSGVWDVNASIDPNGIPNHFSYLGRAETPRADGKRTEPRAVSVTGHNFWKSYSFSATAKSFKGGAMGLCFYFRSPEKNGERPSYYLLRWQSNDAPDASFQIEKTVDGKPTILAKAPGGYVEDEWYRLGIEAINGNLTAFVNGEKIAAASDSEIPSGGIGLYAEGDKGAYFDDVQVEGVNLLLSDTAGPDIWEDVTGRWQVISDIKGESKSWSKRGSGSQQAPAKSIAGSVSWSNYSFDFTAHSDSFGAMFYYENEKNYYLFRQAAAQSHLPYAGRRQVVRRLDGKEEIIAEGRLGKEAEHRTRIEVVDGYIRINENGKPVLETVDFVLDKGKVGLYVERNAEAMFSGLEVRSIDPQSKLRLVDAYDFFSAQIIDASDFADFSEKDYRHIRRVGKYEYYRKEENFFPLVGYHPKSIWKPWAGYCGVTGGELAVRNPSGQAVLWYSEGSLGDAGIEFTARSIGPHTNIGVTICAAERRVEMGYSLSLAIKGRGETQLLRNGQRAQTSAFSLTPRTTYKVRFEKRGRYVIASVNGEKILTYQDKAPLIGDKIALWADRSNVRYDDVKIYVTEYSGLSKYYPFYSAEPDWRVQTGRWVLHSGMTCIPGSHWVLADARPRGAVLWNKRSFDSRSIAVRLAAFEYSEWYGWDKNPSHEHFPYRNIGLTICGDGKDISSGYNFIVGGWNNSRTCILKGNKMAAQTRAAGVTLRSTDVRAVKEGNLLTLYVDGVKALSYKDDRQPLKGDRVALWSWDGCMNLRDVFIHAPSRLADGFSTRGLARYDVTAFVRSIR